MGSNNDSVITDQVDSRLDDLFGDDNNQDVSPETEGMSDDADNGSENHAANVELDNRLDNFFEKENKPKRETDITKSIDPHEIENSSIKELKSVILSLEWEITDQVMQTLAEEISKLETLYKSDKIIVAFLQLLGSLGKYIRKKRAEAHPDSIRLLHSVYESLEKAMLSDELSDAAKKKMLVSQVNRYKKLKKEIVVAKSVVSKKDSPSLDAESETADSIISEQPSVNDDPGYDQHNRKDRIEETQEYDLAQSGMGGVAAHQDILHALMEIKKTIQSEFSALRADLRKWRDEQ
ncbi:Uncharacterized protein dnl_24510 [Desulfonema limicola]|uniref:Uncharacterized protein n=1 Tax=Desulfonema limicola TaxID=45656 RepID=A0A975GGE3_9BACT|nr:hypothetical protein [Desulfonema limicola]QTA80159.1 Uncharacterized protein dnl_24510 [Desulfonema limicola]